MALYRKIGLLPNRGELFVGKTDVDLDNMMTLRTGQVVVMRPTTDAVMVRAVRELDAI